MPLRECETNYHSSAQLGPYSSLGLDSSSPPVFLLAVPGDENDKIMQDHVGFQCLTLGTTRIFSNPRQIRRSEDLLDVLEIGQTGRFEASLTGIRFIHILASRTGTHQDPVSQRGQTFYRLPAETTCRERSMVRRASASVFA
jgi:hypothetical protein